MNRYDKDMMHNRELIYDAKGEIHRIDEQKHEAHGHSASAHKILKHSRKNRS